MTSKEPSDQGNPQTNIHKVPGWLKSAKEPTKKHKVDATWQRLLVEQLLCAALDENQVLQAALREALIEVLFQQPALQGAIETAFGMGEPVPEEDWSRDPVEGEDYTKFSTTILADVICEAVQIMHTVRTDNSPRLAESAYLHIVNRWKREQGRNDE